MSFDRFPKKELKIVILLTISYLLLYKFAVGWLPRHGYFLIAYLLMYFATPTSRKIVKCLLGFWLYIIAYDMLQIVPNYSVNSIHIQDLYETEKAIFGINTIEGRITLNEYFQQHNWGWLDAFTGFSYLLWLPAPLGLAFYFMVKKPVMCVEMLLAFLVTNLIGFIGYYVFPAAAPWYVQMHGFTLDMSVSGSAAGLLRFDDFFNIHLFKDMYSKNANIFAAMPSLHCAYSAVPLYYAYKAKLKKGTLLLFVITLSIFFSAIYTSHHYTIDALLGWICVIVTIIIFEKILLPNGLGKWLKTYNGNV